MKRKQIVAGNWKMNTNYDDGQKLALSIVNKFVPHKTQVIICPPHIQLKNVDNILKDMNGINLGAQNCHSEEKGAYTGEVSVQMLKSVGVQYVIIGHSERREYFNESNEVLTKKVDLALANGINPIFCCGENLDTREAENHAAFVEGQLKDSLFHLSSEEFSNIIIAYEPIWAIGTGKTATSAQAQEMHAHIRKLIAEKYGTEIANSTSILYGGSCKPTNAEEIFSQEDVDGGLIGGASLKADDFIAIVNSFKN